MAVSLKRRLNPPPHIRAMSDKVAAKQINEPRHTGMTGLTRKGEPALDPAEGGEVFEKSGLADIIGEESQISDLKFEIHNLRFEIKKR